MGDLAAVKMIAIDIDGTLLPSESTVVSKRNREALLRAEESGLELVIATGRRQAYAMPLLAPLGLKPQTLIITSNGTVTRSFGGERIDRSFLPVETARALCGVLRQFAGTAVFTFDREGPGELVLESLDALNARIAPWVKANRPWIKEVRPLERAFDSGEAPVQGMVCGAIRDMKEAEEWLQSSPFAAQIEMHRTEYPARDLGILDLLPPGCSKGAALAALAARSGLVREEVMAIGDNYNDLEMLEYAGHPVLMANAAADLLRLGRERGWRMARSNDQDGVAEIIQSVLEERALDSGVPASMVE